MDDTMLAFMRAARRRGLCEEYTTMWTAAKSKKQLLDIALDANGLSYVANAVTKGYITPDYICREFGSFLNGRYTRDKDGYTSKIYCSDGMKYCPAVINASTTAILVIGFVGSINVPENRICEMHLVDSKCYIKGKGRANVYTYGDCEIYNKDEANIKLYGDE